jgi:ubiquinone/menaquinone biosynthesis C-methylase UbiE
LAKIDYEKYHKSDSRTKLSGFEIARWDALEHFIPKNIQQKKTGQILDYGAGTGLHIGLWENLLPNFDLYLCDVSRSGKEKCLLKFPSYENKYQLVTNNEAQFDDQNFDIVFSVEVMEHVDYLEAYIKDIYRLLKPGGVFIWTTPCANKYSIEYIYSSLTNQIDSTSEGYVRWRWEDPTHLRRLKSNEIKKALMNIGFESPDFRFRSHFFSFICTYFPPKSKFQKLRNSLMKLDYNLLRKSPNGASMIGAVTKPSLS